MYYTPPSPPPLSPEDDVLFPSTKAGFFENSAAEMIMPTPISSPLIGAKRDFDTMAHENTLIPSQVDDNGALSVDTISTSTASTQDLRRSKRILKMAPKNYTVDIEPVHAYGSNDMLDMDTSEDSEYDGDSTEDDLNYQDIDDDALDFSPQTLSDALGSSRRTTNCTLSLFPQAMDSTQATDTMPDLPTHQGTNSKVNLPSQIVELSNTDRVMGVLSSMMDPVKRDVWNKLLRRQKKSAGRTPSIPAQSFEAFMNQGQTGGSATKGRDTVTKYCFMTGFMAIYIAFIQIVFQDMANETSKDFFQDFMGHFECGNDVAIAPDDLFTWYYWQCWPYLVSDIRQLFQRERCDRFSSMDNIEAILTKLYTQNILAPTAHEHRKNNGQFFTPKSVVQFMWSICLKGNSNSNIINRLPRVLDPCMGMGAFLCEYVTRLVEKAKEDPEIWNNGAALQSILAQLPESMWGVEIDPFVYKLGKLNIMAHVFPLYQQCRALNTSLDGFSIGRLSLFRSNTLLLVGSDPNPDSTDDATWEHEQLLRLRFPDRLSFDYVLANPPYKIQKLVQLVDPAVTSYNDLNVTCSKGNQAYLYFLRFCLQRIHPTNGQLCVITPSQWTIGIYTKPLREWMWKHCRLLDFHQFQQFKIWNTLGTDSLILRLCMRHQHSTIDPDNNEVKYLQYNSSVASVDQILGAYLKFDRRHLTDNSNDPLVMHKFTPNDDLNHLSNIMNDSFKALSPSHSSLVDELTNLFREYPKLCDMTANAPLQQHRGTSSTPLYGLVVRTQWALETFGKQCCDTWLKPIIYWNGKSIIPPRYTGRMRRADDPHGVKAYNHRDRVFWRNRDEKRMKKRERPPAEAYMHFDGATDRAIPVYSMIMVNREEVRTLNKKSALYQYLREARIELQPELTSKDAIFCSHSQSGADKPVKLIHPWHCCYYTATLPRLRFSIDRHHHALTGQWTYFTVNKRQFYKDKDSGASVKTKSTPAWENYYLGILNSSTFQFFAKTHCAYDQRGRMQLHDTSLAKIPHPPPTRNQVALVDSYVKQLISVRQLLYRMMKYVTPCASAMATVRRCDWDLEPTDRCKLEDICPPYDDLASANDEDGGNMARLLQQGGGNMADRMVRALMVNSFLQYALDQLVYRVYRIPRDLQLKLENNVLTHLTEDWNEHHSLLEGLSVGSVVRALLTGEVVLPPGAS